MNDRGTAQLNRGARRREACEVTGLGRNEGRYLDTSFRGRFLKKRKEGQEIVGEIRVAIAVRTKERKRRKKDASEEERGTYSSIRTPARRTRDNVNVKGMVILSEWY